MTTKKKLLLSLFRPDQQHGQIHHIRPCGTGSQQGAAMVKYRITIVFFQGMTCLLHSRHRQVPGPGASSGSVRRAIGAVRTGKQGADMRAVLQGQAGGQRHFLIAPSPAPAAVDYVAEAERDLSQRMGRACHISHGKKKGRIEIEYYGVDDLNDLLDLLGQLNRS